MATPTHTLNLCGVLSESRRIIKAHRRHFLAVSALFLLPLSFSSIIYPTLQATLSQPNSTSHHDAILLFLSCTTPQHLNKSLLFPVLFSLFSIFLSLCAVATITYSTIHVFHGRPVTILSSLKSLLLSFPRLCSTFIVSEIIMALVCLVVAIFTILIFEGLELLGFDIDYDSKCHIWVVILVTILLVALLVWIQLNWALALVVVVAESKWGYEPLRRSAYLMKGMRGVAFTIIVLYGVFIWFYIWEYYWIPVVHAGGVVIVLNILFLMFQTCFIAWLMLHYVVANAVLYMYCKALHGELALETVEEPARDYVSLPFHDDGEVPHVVSAHVHE